MATITIGVEGQCYFHVDEYETCDGRCWAWSFSYVLGCGLSRHTGSVRAYEVAGGLVGRDLLVERLEAVLERWSREVKWYEQHDEIFDHSSLRTQLVEWLDGKR